MMSLIGQRVTAWRGDRKDQWGVVEKMDGVYHCYVRWDDNEVSHYETAAIIAERFIRK